LEEQSLDDEREDRFGLSSEAGLNDGFAFPFVFLGLYLTQAPEAWRAWIGAWALWDLFYAISLALPLGWIIGLRAGRLVHRGMLRDSVSHKRRRFVPLALLLVAYGLTEALGAYGFLAAFTVGLAFRRQMEAEAEVLERFADFTENLDELFKAAVLFAIGALLPWGEIVALGWPLLGFALALIVVARPAITWVATAGGGFRTLDRAYWGWFGIRGIGSVYYLSYAVVHGAGDEVGRTLFAVTAGVIVTSAVLHGLTVRPFLERFEGETEVEE
jgi:sodium/hydrogen antiporter